MINRSKAYISPLVLENIKDLPFRIVRNTYILSDFRPLEPTIYLKVEFPEGTTEENIIKLYDYEEIEDIFTIGTAYLIVTKLNSRYNYEYLCFKRGNYSWYKPEAKKSIITYLVKNVNNRSLGLIDKIRSVFSRDPMLKNYYENTLRVNLDENAELASIMNEEQETFKSADCPKFERIKKS